MRIPTIRFGSLAAVRDECVITIAALEACFWLEPRASDTRILKTFRDGYGRIRAIAERKLLAHPAARLELTAGDFARP